MYLKLYWLSSSAAAAAKISLIKLVSHQTSNSLHTASLKSKSPSLDMGNAVSK
jgi:hypothetical protein